MRYVWEAQDIVAGRVTSSANRAEDWRIGYDAATRGPAKFLMCSQRDGMVCTKDHTKESLAAWLNEAGHRPNTVESGDHLPPQEVD